MRLSFSLRADFTLSVVLLMRIVFLDFLNEAKMLARIHKVKASMFGPCHLFHSYYEWLQ